MSAAQVQPGPELRFVLGSSAVIGSWEQMAKGQAHTRERSSRGLEVDVGCV